MKSVLLLLFTILFISSIYGYGEPDSDGHPNWVERESLTLLNFVRMNPTAYKNYFMPSNKYKVNSILLPANYPSAAPMYYNFTMNQLALYHSNDMKSNKCFEHSNCDGTSIGSRFSKFLGSCIPGWGENIAVGYKSGILHNNLLLCEKSSDCIADGLDGVGHRNNIMNRGYVQAGIGSVDTYITQDFRSASCQVGETSPIHSGSHTYNVSGTQLTYITTFYNSQLTVESAEIEFSNHTENLVLLFGSSNQGAYIYQPSSSAAYSCEPYRFVFSTNNGTFTYPDTGSLITTSSDCTDTYSDHSPSSANTLTVSMTALFSALMMLCLLF